MKLVTAIALLSLSLVSSLVRADYQQELVRLDTEALAFVQTSGYVMQDPDSLTTAQYYSSGRFPALNSGQMPLLWPDADLDALTRAVLLLDAREGDLPHVRYLLRYNINVSPDYPELRHDYVEVTRFNLGPERRRDVLEYVDEEHVADPAEFGVGPHVSWRFAMAPVMGMLAGVNYAARRDVPDAEARATDCLGAPCLSLIDAEGPSRTWTSLASPQLASAPYLDKNPMGTTRAARIVQELWAGLTSEGMDPLPYKPDQPQFLFVTSVDVSGQDALAYGLVQQAVVLDHTVREIWIRRDEAFGTPVRLVQTHVPRR